MKKIIQQISALILIAVITLCTILIIQKTAGRSGVDYTEDKLYTLSGGSKKIISSIQEPIQLKLFYARTVALKGKNRLRFLNSYYLYVRDLLEEYVNRSNENITLQIIDPIAFTDAEEAALEYGIQKIPINQDENFYFGLAATTESGRGKVIKFFEPQRQELAEYDISKTIVELLQRDKRSLGVISSLPIMGDDMSPYMMQMMQMQGRQPQQAWGLISHLKQAYDIQEIKAETLEIPKSLDYLLVVHPKDLSQSQLFSIDQFVMRGGKLVVLVDPHCFVDRPAPNPQNPYAAMGYKSASNLNALTKKWGISLKDDAIAVDRAIARSTPLGQGQAAEVVLPLLGLNADCVNPDEVISAKLNDLSFLFAGSLMFEEVQGVELRKLLMTTSTGSTWTPQNPMELQNLNPQAILKAYVEGTEPVILASMATGTFESNFPDGIEVPDESASKKAPKAEAAEAIKMSSADAAVVVIADVDFITDNFAYQNSMFGLALRGQNSSIILNSLEFLGGNEDLITIRSRARFQRPFIVVDEIERAAEKKTETAMEGITARLQKFQTELQNLGAQVNDSNQSLIQSTALLQRQKVEAEIRLANKELRVLQNQRREEVESLKSSLKLKTIVGAPAVIFLIALILAGVRVSRSRAYTARRN